MASGQDHGRQGHPDADATSIANIPGTVTTSYELAVMVAALRLPSYAAFAAGELQSRQSTDLKTPFRPTRL